VEQVTFRCACCRRILRRNSRVKKQQYCGAKACQQARKNRWQREKQQTDVDYRVNKSESQRAWLKTNPTYWRQYRSRNPEYQERNRQLQQARDKKRPQTAADHLAKKGHVKSIFQRYNNDILHLCRWGKSCKDGRVIGENHPNNAGIEDLAKKDSIASGNRTGYL
jgi:hypothetical protein